MTSEQDLDVSQAQEGEGGSEKPPQLTVTSTSSPSPSMNNADHPLIALPPPESGAFTASKEPGLTRMDLEQLVIAEGGVVHDKQCSDKKGSYTSPSPISSPSLSESEWSASTRPNSQAPSRAGSVSDARRPDVLLPPSLAPKKPQTRSIPDTSDTAPPSSSATSTTPSAQPPPPTGVRRKSVGENEKHKFTLKDLLSSGPKLSRRSSARSTGSSKKSDSDGDRKSTAGDSVGSLSKKYGICQKLAIGKGATSVVRLAHKWDRSEEKLYAIKEFRKRRKNESEKEYVKKLTAEFCISSTLHHINIVETVDLVQDENQHWCEVMEFCPGGDLYDAIKKGGMSPSEVECCFKQMLNGVLYLHNQGVAHRDLKPENLFFDTKGHLKIGDYGASTVYRLPWESTIHMSTGLCGSEPYIAPEQFLGKPYDARLVDIWACGVVYYCLHFQEIPWRVAQPSDTLYAAYAQACASPIAATSACPSTINLLNPRACRPLIRKMLEPDPKLRSPIEDVIKHAWVQEIELCHDVPEPKHVHVNANAMAKLYEES